MMQRHVQGFLPLELVRVDGFLLHTRGQRAATVLVQMTGVILGGDSCRTGSQNLQH